MIETYIAQCLLASNLVINVL